MSSVEGTQLSSYTYPTMALREIRDYTQHLSGVLKTIIDAAVADPRQNKAAKDLAHNALWTEHYEAVKLWCEAVTADALAQHTRPQARRPFPFETTYSLPSPVIE